ncbi:MAG TPA: histidine phosphatase family protein [Candidatus Parcubacteria bacterium]|nr:histidine phosphatase family protein [Candidatus Parcubacteria bacterium]
MKTIVLFRHGESKYSGFYPDVTREGTLRVLKNVRVLLSKLGVAGDVQIDQDVEIYTSPAVRAIATAMIIKDAVDCRLRAAGRVIIDNRLRSMDVYRKNVARKVVACFSLELLDKWIGVGHPLERLISSKKYPQGSVFEDPLKIKERSMDFLDSLKNNSNLAFPAIVVTHWEVITWLTDCVVSPGGYALLKI